MLTLVATVLCAALGIFPSQALGAAAAQPDLWGSRFQNLPLHHQAIKPRHGFGGNAVRRWNDAMLDANAIDHARSLPDQLGPLRTARAFAIVHIAIFDALNAIAGRYKSFTGLDRVTEPISVDAAVAQAAHDTLAALFPAQAARFDALLTKDLSRIRDGRAKNNGIFLGQQAAAAVLALRANDGSQHSEEFYGTQYTPAPGPNKWHQDPISMAPIALGSLWGDMVEPFVLVSAEQFPVAPPPAAGSAAFIAAFDEVKNYGGCGSDPGADCAETFGGSATPTLRTPEQTQIGIFWGYDGTPGLGTPPRLYNQIAMRIAERKGSNGIELARLLALVNVAMADAGLAAWKVKYDHEFGRPVTVIRDSGLVTWTPLGAPASNKLGPNFTPPFPAYTSGHATFGAALFQTLRRFYGTDRIAFTFESD
jgi:hypothetical protein